jgi:phosphoglycerate kinase
LARDRAMVGPEERITDAGPRALERLRALAGEAAFILWNGPLGEYEAGFRVGTEAAARFFAEVTARGAHTVVGGGDTLAAIKALALPERSFSFISTGGGAMLDFLAAGTLPGIEALRLR